ncbi:hypothetical protein IIC65_03150 [Candidatus Sumerlaeota bacterium]|nr:hypothetical protein [Candidatus Sumerlaeota bacterium]
MIVWLGLGCATMDSEKTAQREQLAELFGGYIPRWVTNEEPYEDARSYDKMGRNVRDGLIGFIDSYAQGLFAALALVSPGGFIVQKLSTMAGDVVGLIDDNALTEHVLKGIISRQFLKYGASARNFLTTLGSVHQTSFAGGDQPDVGAYVGDRTFHTEVYGYPSGVATLGAAILADFVVRPFGNVLLIFGARETAGRIDQAGLDLIGRSAKVHFF